MNHYTPVQVIKLAVLAFIVFDFIKESSKQGRINLADFPSYLFLLFGRILDTFSAILIGLFSTNNSLLSVIKGLTLNFKVKPYPNSTLTQNRDLEAYWLKWGRQRINILIQTLERSGAQIMVAKNKLPGYIDIKTSPAQPVPTVRTFDFKVQYSATEQEVYFIPVYYYGVDPTLRSSIRQRVDDGTISVALGVPASDVSFCERGQEVIAVRVRNESAALEVEVKASIHGPQTLPPRAYGVGNSPEISERKLVDFLDLSPLGEGLPPLSLFNSPKTRQTQNDDGYKLIIDAFNRLNLGVDSSGQSRFKYLESIFGPAITQVIFKTPSGVKITSLAREGENIAAELGIAGSVRITAVPGMPGCVGIEVPNRQRELVTIQEMVASPTFRQCRLVIPICIGMTLNGKPLVVDLARLPHLLIAGATNQGKSVGLNAMIVSLLTVFTPDRLKLIMIDPKAVELTVYEDLPHLLAPIATEAKEAKPLLNLMVHEMEHRYSLMRAKKVRNIIEYNSKIKTDKKLPYIVGIIDEYADLMMGAKSEAKDLEVAVARLGQKARAAGLHLILATQRPTADVVTGLIKANMPSRLAYKVASSIDSQVILDRPGAESLTGMGDLLLLSPTDPEPIRAQGPLVTDEEIERLVDFWRKHNINNTAEAEREEEAFPESQNLETEGLPIKIKLVKQPLSQDSQVSTSEAIKSPSTYDFNRKLTEEFTKVPNIPNIPEVLIVEGKRGVMVNLGLPVKPEMLNMNNDTWALLYGISVRTVVRDQAPRREYLKTLLHVRTDVAQSLMQYMESRKIISPYKGPNSPRQIYISMDQVEKVYPESTFAMHIYTESHRVK